jgi:hypothetical protein
LHFPRHARKGRKFLERSAEVFSPKLAPLSTGAAAKPKD